MTQSTKQATRRPVPDKFNVGDLVEAADGKLVYMLTQRSNSHPLRVGSRVVSGICVWTSGGKDKDGDELPNIGFFHDNIGEDYLQPFHGNIKLTT